MGLCLIRMSVDWLDSCPHSQFHTPMPSVWYSIIDINIYIFLCGHLWYFLIYLNMILLYSQYLCLSYTLWCCSFKRVKVDVSRVLPLLKNAFEKKTKCFSMKLLSVTTQSCNPVLVPESGLSCDARTFRFPLLSPPWSLWSGSSYT